MRTMLMSRALPAVLAGLVLACGMGQPAGARPHAQAEAAQGTPQHLATEPLDIRTSKGPVHFRVQVAADEPSREKGLMFRKSMRDNEGMIFDFPDVQMRSFWMRNTLIPLDMLFVGADGRVVSIARQARPLDESAVGSQFPARAVIEINGGLAERLGIQPGDQVRDRKVFHNAH